MVWPTVTLHCQVVTQRVLSAAAVGGKGEGCRQVVVEEEAGHGWAVEEEGREDRA